MEEKTLWHGDERIPLAPKVFDTLQVLLENHGRLMSKDRLMNEIWGETFVEERNLAQNIFTLRKELKKRETDTNFIETIPRRGYKFIAEIRPIESIQEQSVAIKHEKSLKLTAEGSISKAELAEAVKEITQDLISNGKADSVERKKNDSKQDESKFSRFNLMVFAGVLTILTLGIGFWSWQNGYINTKNLSLSGHVDLSRIKFDRLTDSGNAFYPAISPDKKHLAYVKNEDSQFSIWLQNIVSGSETVVVPAKEFEMRSLEFSNDGSHLFYGARDGKMETTVYRVPIFGGTPDEIVTNVNQNFSLSPDGKHLAYFRNDPKTRGNKLLVCNINGNDEKIISHKKNGSLFRVWGSVPKWSPDGKKIVAVSIATAPDERGLKRPHLVEIDVESGIESPIKSPRWENVMSAQWNSSGDALIVRAQERPEDYFKIYKLSYPEGQAEPLTNDTDNYTEFALAPNDEFLIATEERNPYNLQLIPTENPLQIRSLTESTNIKYGVDGLQWMPNGNDLVFCKTEGLSSREIWKINVLTNEQMRLTFDKGKTNKLPKVARGGKYIFYVSNRSGQYQIWRMKADGSDQTQITEIEGGADFPEVSSDGKWLVYATDAIKPNKLWKQSLEDGERRMLLENAGGKSFISPDMSQIIASYYDPEEKENDPWKYLLIPFDDEGNLENRRSIAHYLDVSWNPNGKGIYFLTRGQSHANVSYFSLGDQSVTRITNYESQIIANLSVSPDGKLIAVARGKRTSNIVKLSNF